MCDGMRNDGGEAVLENLQRAAGMGQGIRNPPCSWGAKHKRGGVRGWRVKKIVGVESRAVLRTGEDEQVNR